MTPRVRLWCHSNVSRHGNLRLLTYTTDRSKQLITARRYRYQSTSHIVQQRPLSCIHMKCFVSINQFRYSHNLETGRPEGDTDLFQRADACCVFGICSFRRAGNTGQTNNVEANHDAAQRLVVCSAHVTICTAVCRAFISRLQLF
jgi:hypothetical protein